ncbi:MAG: DUF5702 domain-containing protein, partial [Clostridiales Family XIII bacterium]|nr:DUF5702 domain-containing protein [Clostridiales Family XIII bacterium]
ENAIGSAEEAVNKLNESEGKEGKKQEANIVDGKLYLFYSDYLYIFMLMGFNGGRAENMYERMGDLMQANIRHMGGRSFTMSKATVYYKLECEVTVPPLMLALPISTEYTSSGFKGWTFKEKMIRGYQ